jgi:RNA polymerase sigma-70 factor (ECF subfamily)
LEEATDLPDTLVNMEEMAQKRDDFKRLSRLLAHLSDRERELVALKYGAGLTNRSIARLSGLNESNVAVILHRIIIKLSAEWEMP